MEYCHFATPFDQVSYMGSLIHDLTRKKIPKGAKQCATYNCSKIGMTTCKHCKHTWYCSKKCQQADWKSGHEASCVALRQPYESTTAVSSSQKLTGALSKPSMAPTLDTATVDSSESFEAPEDTELVAGIVSAPPRQDAWYKDLTKRDRIYERLWMSFQLRTNDEYTMGGNLVGLYAAVAEGEPYQRAPRDFRKYLRAFKDRHMLPPDWSSLDRRAVITIAEVKLLIALEPADILRKFGKLSREELVLREMAEMAIGPVGEWFDCCYVV